MNTQQPQLSFPFLSTTPRARCESPAEEQVLFALVRAGWLQTEAANDNGAAPMLTHPLIPAMVCFQQLELEHLIDVRLRADFVFRDFRAQRGLVLEVDGDRHHVTARQVARDKMNDRRINSRPGWTIRRYVAAEVLNPKRANRVVTEVVNYLRSGMNVADVA